MHATRTSPSSSSRAAGRMPRPRRRGGPPRDPRLPRGDARRLRRPARAHRAGGRRGRGRLAAVHRRGHGPAHRRPVGRARQRHRRPRAGLRRHQLRMLGHPSAPVLAAALAAGELALADGRAVTHAFLLGFEVETTLAEVINPAHYEHGWHATCTLGTMGAAAAAARLLGLDADQTRSRWPSPRRRPRGSRRTSAR